EQGDSRTAEAYKCNLRRPQRTGIQLPAKRIAIGRRVNTRSNGAILASPAERSGDRAAHAIGFVLCLLSDRLLAIMFDDPVNQVGGAQEQMFECFLLRLHIAKLVDQLLALQTLFRHRQTPRLVSHEATS